MWTTYYNLKSWLDNWERDLLELGFANKNEKEETIIPEDQLARILNIDETCLAMDGSTSQRGGRPAVIFTSVLIYVVIMPYLSNLLMFSCALKILQKNGLASTAAK